MDSEFQCIVAWPYCFGPVVRQNIMEGACGRAKLLTSRQPGRERKRGRRKGRKRRRRRIRKKGRGPT
jgi:hypothetical protein